MCLVLSLEFDLTVEETIFVEISSHIWICLLFLVVIGAPKIDLGIVGTNLLPLVWKVGFDLKDDN